MGECVQNFGNGLTESDGRLDGYLHWVVLPEHFQCPNDDNHVRLQVKMNGQFYDVSVNIQATGSSDPNVYHYDLHADLFGGPWSEGWHTFSVGLDYVYVLGVNSENFVSATLEELVVLFESEIVPGLPISVFMNAYGSGGGHNVHRNNYFPDGAIVINPKTNPHYFLFRFGNQSF
jgi:hypothetical protein